MTRLGTPKWTHVQLKAMYGGSLEYEKVHSALIRMFGGDHKPNSRDMSGVRESKEEGFYKEHEDKEFYCEDNHDYDGWNEAYYEEDWDKDYDEEDPEELEVAAD